MAAVVIVPMVAGPTHAFVIATLQNACFPDDPWSAGSIAGLLMTPGTFALIASDEGFVMARAAGGEGEILALGVRSAARRRGVARGLVEAALHALVERGAESVFLEVAEDNAAARALYTATGFQAVGRRPGYYRRANTRIAAIIMRADPSGGARPRPAG